MPENLSPIARVVRRFYPGARLLRSWALSGGISAVMTALEIEQPGGAAARLVLRQPGEAAVRANPNAARDEYRVLRTLFDRGLPVPRPVGLDESAEILPGAYLVSEYVDGGARFDLDEACLTQAAEALAAVHSLKATRFDCAGLPDSLDEVSRRLGGKPPESGLALDASGVWAALKAACPPRRDNPPALLHGDFWPGNWLWQGGRLAAVIDWEDACLGDPLSDLAIARLDVCWIFSPRAMDCFTTAYLARAGCNTAALPFWDLWAALRLARLVGRDLDGWAGFFHPYGRADISAVSIRACYDGFAAQAVG